MKATSMDQNKLPEGYDNFHTIENHLRLISNRERQVYDMLYSPMDIKEMAKEINISHKTVKYHLTNIYKKLITS